jgi:hypothetical protein
VLNKTGGKWLTPYIDEHRPECDGGRAEDSRSSEFEEGRRGWKKCACLIHVSGTLGGKFSRKQTGKSAWDESKGVVAIWKRPGLGTTRPLPVTELRACGGRYSRWIQNGARLTRILRVAFVDKTKQKLVAIRAAQTIYSVPESIASLNPPRAAA